MTSSLRETWRYGVLLAALLLVLAVFPVVDGNAGIRWLLDLAFLVLIASSISAVWRKPGTGRVALVVGIAASIALLLEIVGVGERTELLQIARPGLVLIFITLISLGVLGDVLRRRDVDADTVAGACCVYLFFGLGWAQAYNLVEIFTPGGAFGTDVSEPFTLAYFSFITLTTTGYGDVSPVSAGARSLAVLESVVGQLYLAVLVARFVGLHIARGGAAE